MINDDFETDKFAVQVIARGSFVDSDTGNGKVYIIETTVLRLNYVALNVYLDSECLNCRECYADGEEGDRAWEEHKAEKSKKRNEWENAIKETLGLNNCSTGSVCITHSQSEVFTVVHTWKHR